MQEVSSESTAEALLKIVEEIAGKRIGLHAFWLYGVLVGLAIQQALTSVTGHLINPPLGMTTHTTQAGVRLGVFLLLIIRYYLGAVFFFDVAYSGPREGIYRKKNYFLDFVIGLVRFALFLLLAVSIDVYSVRATLFQGIFLSILLFDWVWYLVSWKYDTRHLIKMWAFLATVTVLVGVLLYLVGYEMGYDSSTRELFGMLPVILISIFDLTELISGRRLFAQWLSRLIADVSQPLHYPHIDPEAQHSLQQSEPSFYDQIRSRLRAISDELDR